MKSVPQISPPGPEMGSFRAIFGAVISLRFCYRVTPTLFCSLPPFQQVFHVRAQNLCPTSLSLSSLSLSIPPLSSNNHFGAILLSTFLQPRTIFAGGISKRRDRVRGERGGEREGEGDSYELEVHRTARALIWQQGSSKSASFPPSCLLGRKTCPQKVCRREGRKRFCYSS